ncbi:hypothetical protein EDC61_101146 [Sulfuritortus calidifontis]|uniref:Lipoprotein n=1 Tax=Sulfuritortus calidifontis TaxID=1914471 RepID=A0A4R3JYY3_9PROT|nr:hypothetical protein [Sulfuritortus calidifontis]TCS73924.1 hypothetical protein EDC61_101146 [Sulfuritortus calidifontis]
MRMVIAAVLMLALLAGCSQPIKRKDGASSARTFSLGNLAKAEADMLTEINQREVLKSLRLLTEKLYRRNPQEYRKAGLDSAEAATQQLFAELDHWPESVLARLDWERSFRQSFDESYAGDRVQSFMAGLLSMVMAAYEHKREFYLVDELDAQKLYNSARNVETAVWKLSTARQAGGARFLLSNSIEGEVQNLSFEREFAKIIALQDLLALYVEDRSNRSIARVVQGAASFVFLPI